MDIKFSDKIKIKSNIRIAETYNQYDAENNNPANKTHSEEVDAIQSSSNIALLFNLIFLINLLLQIYIKNLLPLLEMVTIQSKINIGVIDIL